MRRIIYASRAVHDVTDVELLALLNRARDVNAEHSVTGMLVYAARSFLQLFEGDDAAVEIIWDRIRMSPLHADLRVLEDGPIAQRQFGEWSMGFEHPSAEELEQTLHGYRGSNPYPFVSADLVEGPSTAETLLSLYARRSD